MASSRSEENVNLRHFQHIMVSQCWWALQFYGLIVFFDYGRCYSHWFIAIWCYWQMLLPCCHYVCNLCCFVWLMLLPCCLLFHDRWWCSYHQADVVAMFLIGRCYCHVANVVATNCVCYLADVITWWLELLPLLCSDVFWQMLLPEGWWNCLPWVWVADGVATGSML